jgi:hypothetical protein
VEPAGLENVVVEAEEHEILWYWRSVNSKKHDNREPQFYAISAATNNRKTDRDKTDRD